MDRSFVKSFEPLATWTKSLVNAGGVKLSHHCASCIFSFSNTIVCLEDRGCLETCSALHILVPNVYQRFLNTLPFSTSLSSDQLYEM